jgi:hypothetical protein
MRRDRPHKAPLQRELPRKHNRELLANCIMPLASVLGVTLKPDAIHLDHCTQPLFLQAISGPC